MDFQEDTTEELERKRGGHLQAEQRRAIQAMREIGRVIGWFSNHRQQ